MSSDGHQPAAMSVGSTIGQSAVTGPTSLNMFIAGAVVANGNVRPGPANRSATVNSAVNIKSLKSKTTGD